ncbi:hypothetical protein [Sphingomonas bacterium]|uniref:hypothetical protein n=1 Tax=Sphingomonas bacterium TaxID=1895847 RepID=UPI001576E9C2|nr:hypothetical protein [Sphingomonas bacterium]
MTDPNAYLILASTGLAGLGIVVTASLAGWRGWLALRRVELERSHGMTSIAPAAGTRIEIADLKERIRKLEAIAAGVDL